jgi:hypothetical protein
VNTRATGADQDGDLGFLKTIPPLRVHSQSDFLPYILGTLGYRRHGLVMTFLQTIARAPHFEQELGRVCFLRRANAWVKLPERLVTRLEDERGDFWWLLIRDQPTYRDFFAFPFSSVSHALVPRARVERRFHGRFIEIGWNISIGRREGRYWLTVHGNSSHPVDISPARNDTVALRSLTADAAIVAVAMEQASAVRDAVGWTRKRGMFVLDPARDTRHRVSREVVVRYGQPDFRRNLLDLYGNRCAVTGCQVIEVLAAAHIAPYRGEHAHHPANGLPLRSDVHLLFDAGLLAVRPTDYRVVIADRLARGPYSDLARRKIIVPRAASARPSREALALRLSTFRGIEGSAFCR